MARPKTISVNNGIQQETKAKVAKVKAEQQRVTQKYAQAQKNAQAEEEAIKAQLEKGFHYAIVPALDA